MRSSWRWLGLMPLLGAVLVRCFLREAIGGVALLAVSCVLLVLCWSLGRALFAVIPLRVPSEAEPAACLIAGVSLWLLFGSLLLLVHARADAQAVSWTLLLVAATGVGLRRGAAGGPPREPAWPLALLPVLLAVVLAALPLLVGDAFSVAGHDHDSLAHQDGGVHAVLVLFAQRGDPRAVTYPLGIHSFLAGAGNLLGLDAFRSLAAGIPLLGGLLAAAAFWLARSWGLERWPGLVAALLVASQPLLLFVGMEQFVPQLAACGLCTAAFAAASQPWEGEPAPRARQLARVLLLALPLAALLSTYPLAFLILLPVILGMARWQGRAPGSAIALVLALAFVFSPLGTVRLAGRVLEIGAHPAGTFEPARAATPGPLLSPDGSPLATDAQVAAAVSSWNLTLAHLLGLSPFRDHFHHGASRLLPPGSAHEARAALWVWSVTVVPIATGLLALLALGALWRPSPRAGPLLVAAFAAAVYVLYESGLLFAYHAFKLLSLIAPAAAVLTVLGAWGVLTVRWRRWVVGALLLSRLPALAAVEAEYCKALALDRNFAALVVPLLDETRGRRVQLLEPSLTRAFWMRRLVLAEATEVPSAELAELILCSTAPRCPEGAVRLERGAVRLLVPLRAP